MAFDGTAVVAQDNFHRPGGLQEREFAAWPATVTQRGPRGFEMQRYAVRSRSPDIDRQVRHQVICPTRKAGSHTWKCSGSYAR